MRGVNYLTDENGNKTALLINLKRHDNKVNELLEDLEDIMDCEAVKNEPAVPFEDAVRNLYRKKKISKKVYEQIVKNGK